MESSVNGKSEVVELSDKDKEILSHLYYDVSGGYGGVRQLLEKAKERISGISLSDVINWLRSQDTYGVHLPYRRKFKRSRIIVKGKDYMWEMDLMDIDVFSKYVWVASMKGKSGFLVVEEVKRIIKKSGRHPRYVRTDKGKEFVNKEFKELMRS